MYVQGVSTRKVTEITQELCGLDVSSSQVSRAAKLLDDELQSWRSRPLAKSPYLILDARYRPAFPLIRASRNTNRSMRNRSLMRGISDVKERAYWEERVAIATSQTTVAIRSTRLDRNLPADCWLFFDRRTLLSRHHPRNRTMFW
jgi:hypothetical protein